MSIGYFVGGGSARWKLEGREVWTQEQMGRESVGTERRVSERGILKFNSSKSDLSRGREEEGSEQRASSLLSSPFLSRLAPVQSFFCSTYAAYPAAAVVHFVVSAPSLLPSLPCLFAQGSEGPFSLLVVGGHLGRVAAVVVVCAPQFVLTPLSPRLFRGGRRETSMNSLHSI